MEPGLYETGTFRTPNYTFPNGCHACEVEIDPETGKVDVVGYSIVDDVGTVINPRHAEGVRFTAALPKAWGQVLMEQVVYDPDSGQLMTGSFQDYAMPRGRRSGRDPDRRQPGTDEKTIPSASRARARRGRAARCPPA